MPTGYTVNIEKGISFKEFALDCARAFGALISMREESRDKPIPKELKADTKHHDDAIVVAEAEIARLNGMSLAEAENCAASDYQDALQRWSKSVADTEELRKKYFAMREQVVAWEPPSKDHDGLKQFMLQQIDCCKFEYTVNDEYAPKKMSGKEWRTAHLEWATRDLQYHSEQRVKAIILATDRTEWINLLRESL